MDNVYDIGYLLERIVHKYSQLEQMKRSYGTGMLFSRAEIHTVAAIGDFNNINITTLSRNLGITKGAASQMVYKLVDKKLVEKKISPNSDSEVVLTLTEEGKRAYQGHKAFHEDSSEKIFQLFRDMPDDEKKRIMSILEQFDSILDERICEDR